MPAPAKVSGHAPVAGHVGRYRSTMKLRAAQVREMLLLILTATPVVGVFMMSEQSCREAFWKRSRTMETPREFVERNRSGWEQVMGGIVLSAFRAGS